MTSTPRLFAQWLSERLGQQFIVENRPGAGELSVRRQSSARPADGYHALPRLKRRTCGHDADGQSPYSNFTPRHDQWRDSSSVYGAVTVHPSFPAKTLPELICRWPIERPGQASRVGQAELEAPLISMERSLPRWPASTCF